MVAALRALPRRPPAGALHHDLRHRRRPVHHRARHRRDRKRGLALGDPWLPQDELAAVLAGETPQGQRAERRRLRRLGHRASPPCATPTARSSPRSPSTRRPLESARPAACRRPLPHPGGHAPGGRHPLQPGRGRGHHRRPHRPLQPPLPARAPRGGARARAGAASARLSPAVLRLRRVQGLQRRLRPQGRRRRSGAHRPHHRGLQPAGRSGRPLRRRGVRAGAGRHRRRRRAARSPSASAPRSPRRAPWADAR